MKDLVQYLAKSLVNESGRRRSHAKPPSDGGSVLQLKVAKEDLGRIIGKQGRTAKSIRTLVNAAATISNRRVVLEIFEEN